MDKASLSRTVEALRKRQYLRVARDAADKRARNVEISLLGSQAMDAAEASANRTVEEVLSGCDGEARGKLHDALRLFRLSALRKNLASNPKRIRIEPLREPYNASAMALLIDVFSGEQGIPEHLVPLPQGMEPKWWCVRVGEDVIGVVAAWHESGQWHWGRFAVDLNLRGLGIGKRMAAQSFQALFDGVTDRVVIDARDLTVEIVKKMGGRQTGPPFDFFGQPVTPMTLQKDEFLAYSGQNATS